MAIWLVHRKLVLDSFGTVPRETLKRIASFAEWVDVTNLRHGEGHSCHRVGKYQREFERFGGKVCSGPGAEDQVVAFFLRAQTCSAEELPRVLGIILHHVLDAFCAEHIFPYRENNLRHPLAPHLTYSIHMALLYKQWSLRIRNAPIVSVSGPEDIRRKIVEFADCISQFPCNYLRQDGCKVRDPRLADNIPWVGWRMSDEYTGLCLEMAAGLSKGILIHLKEATKQQCLVVFL